jgi:tRNA G10  N-methylase Trm11
MPEEMMTNKFQEFHISGLPITPAPYVFNGPKDQNSFHEALIKLQIEHVPSGLTAQEYYTRLSLVREAGQNISSQYLLESPRPNAKSWNSNYGPHGWHRYVGRFPSHLVRGLLNYFGASKSDIILDPFAGSGTTLVEARLLGIPSVGIEICPLSCLISRTKANFPSETENLTELVYNLSKFYDENSRKFLKAHQERFTHKDVLDRKGNMIERFANIEKWFTPEALLGVSLITEFASRLDGYERDFVLLALSSKMRSIGNVDVDVVRAEYRKIPRLDVNVLRLVKRQLLSFIDDIHKSQETHESLISESSTSNLIQGSVLDVKLEPGSISHIITSPPYGVESLSYLRTHLLSYRVLKNFLGEDPYKFSKNVIGSEFICKEEIPVDAFEVDSISAAYHSFFKELVPHLETKKDRVRGTMMMHFFEEMLQVIRLFSIWVKPGGYVAFVIGNKRIKGKIIPSDKIINEIFMANNFQKDKTISHKLKTNNSNSSVPWQDKIIDKDFVMIFRRK